MKIEFEDGSFITLDQAHSEDQLLITMCGLIGRKATMSSSTLNAQQIKQVIDYLQKWYDLLKK